MIQRILLIAAVALSAPAFAQNRPAVPEPANALAAPVVASIVLTPESPSVIAGQTSHVTGQALDVNGKPVPNATIRFRGGSFEGAVNEDGTIIGGVAGRIETTVTAIVEGQKPVVRRLRIPVLPGPATTLNLNPMPARLLAGQEIVLHTQVLSDDNSLRDGDVVTWTSSSAKVATVAADGTLKATSPGKTTITAKTAAAERSFAVEVLPGNIRSIAITPAKPNVRTGDVVDFKVAVTDASGREIPGLTPAWSFSPVAGQMEPDGKFVAYQEGAYTVTALVGNHAATTIVTASPRLVRQPAAIVGSYIPDSRTSELWLHPNGKVAYVGSFVGKLHVLDVSDPTKPTLTDDIQINARLINDVMSSEDGKVLVATREGADNRKNGIVMFSLDDPLHPKQVGEFVDPVTSGVHSAYVNTQAKYGRFVYLTADGQGRLYIVNIDDPANPKVASTWEMPLQYSGKYLHDVQVVDGIMYLSYVTQGLWIVDVGNGIKGGSPSNPVVITNLHYDHPARNRAIEMESGGRVVGGTHTAWRDGKYVFITDEILSAGRANDTGLEQGWGGLQVIDVSDIFHPKPVAWYNPNIGGTHNIWVQNGMLYMGVYNGGFQAFDVSGELRGDLLAQGRQVAYVNPVNAKGKIPNHTYTWGTVVRGDNIYVTDIDNGFFTIKLKPKVDTYNLESGMVATP